MCGYRAPGAGLDSDGDTISNADEMNLGTNWLAADSDLDGIRDDVDPNKLQNAALADPDGANQSAFLDGFLIGRWDFETFVGNSTPAAAITRASSAPNPSEAPTNQYRLPSQFIMCPFFAWWPPIQPP